MAQHRAAAKAVDDIWDDETIEIPRKTLRDESGIALADSVRTSSSSSSMDGFGECASLDEMNELHNALTVGVLRLESLVDDQPAGDAKSLLLGYLRSARRMRDLLLRAAAETAPVRSFVPTFEDLLADCIRCIYAWTLDAIDSLERTASPPEATAYRAVAAIPGPLQEALWESVELCSIRHDPRGTFLVDLLRKIDATLFSLVQKGHRLNRISEACRD